MSSTGLNPSLPGFLLLVPLLCCSCSDDEPTSSYPPADWAALANRKSGISLGLTGENGVDWAAESTYHDSAIANQLIYLKAPVSLALAHNEHNTILLDTDEIPRILGVSGPDGVPLSGDEGDIHFKIDRDMQSHAYSGDRDSLPDFAPRYGTPFDFATLTYDGSEPVLGALGDNGGSWASSPRDTIERYAYGQQDAFGNEWHSLAYWDNDVPLITEAGVDPHRQGASDGHSVLICVNPLTPVIQLSAPAGEQFYTTPLKTYHVPVLWPRTTYLTGGVELAFANLTNSEPVSFRVDDGAFQTWNGTPLVASDIFADEDVPLTFEVRAGANGIVLRRSVVLNPGVPATDEDHGHLLWQDDAEQQALTTKLRDIEPFKTSYDLFWDDDYYHGTSATFADTRGGWRHEAGQASTALSNAFSVAIEGAGATETQADLAKTRLLRLARLRPLGFETSVSHATPAKDFLNELGQTLQQFADAAVAYDLLAAHYRQSDHPQGMSPIEEIWIRDGLAKIAKSIIQFRSNNGATSGSGDSHWAHGYELAIGAIALALPTYQSPYYGVSGGDLVTENDLTNDDGQYWNPFPDQGVTWYGIATDSAIDTPGHPNVVAPFRAEFLLSDDGWWTGANDLQCDGDRYFEGPDGDRLVDVKHGGLANAEGRVELVEMSGYESPFVTRLYVFDHMRRIKGDPYQTAAVNNYLRRRLVNGIVRSSWDDQQLIYTNQAPSITSALYGFHHRYNYASLPGPLAMASQFLTDLNAYYGLGGTIDDATHERLEQERKMFYHPYGLALCDDPSMLPGYQVESNHAPFLKALFKHVVTSGALSHKEIVAVDPDGDQLTITVQGLPTGATFDNGTHTIEWTPTATSAEVHIVQVTADDGQTQTTRPFAMILKPDAPAGPIPAGPDSVTAQLSGASAVALSWSPPDGVTVAAYFIYRDGLMWAAVAGSETTWVDQELIVPGSNTRYHVSACDTQGAESHAAGATPGYLHVPTP